MGVVVIGNLIWVHQDHKYKVSLRSSRSTGNVGIKLNSAIRLNSSRRRIFLLMN